MSLRDSSQRDEVFSELCLTYRIPLYAFLRRHGESPQDAEDLVQGFLSKVAQQSALEKVSPEKGKLRTFLKATLRNYLLNRKEHDRALRRGGGKTPLPLDVEEVERVCAPELADGVSPDLAYDRSWARTVLRRSMARLEEEHRIMRKSALFEEFSALLDGADSNEYEVVGTRLGMRPNAVAVGVFRFKKRLRELFLAEVTETVGSRTEAEMEVRELLETLARS